MRATFGVAKVAKVPQFILRWDCIFMSGGRAVAGPAASEGKAAGMQPGSVFQLLHRHEKRTRHLSVSLRARNFQKAHSTQRTNRKPVFDHQEARAQFVVISFSTEN